MIANRLLRAHKLLTNVVNYHLAVKFSQMMCICGSVDIAAYVR